MSYFVKRTSRKEKEILAKLSDIIISYHPKINPSKMVQVKNSKEAFELLIKSWDLGTIYLREEFKILVMNASCKVKGIHSLSIGGITGTIADPRIIIALATGCLATSVILAHNHPSGSTKPSEADFQLTQRLKSALALVDVKLLDHLIITPTEYLSMAEEGIISDN
jgi:DNA repair protein RadC